MVVERCTDSYTVSHRTGFAYMGCNTWGVGNPVRLAVRHPGVVQVPLVVAVAAAVVAAVAVAVAVAAAAAAGAQANLSHRRVAHCVH